MGRSSNISIVLSFSALQSRVSDVQCTVSRPAASFSNPQQNWGPRLDLKNQKLQGQGPASYGLTNPPRDSNTHCRSRAPGLSHQCRFFKLWEQVSSNSFLTSIPWVIPFQLETSMYFYCNPRGIWTNEHCWHMLGRWVTLWMEMRSSVQKIVSQNPVR